MTEDILVPKFDSTERRSPIVVATFNLCATVIGGGVLSVPLAFAKCGIILGTLLLLLAAVITERTSYLLCLCSRHTGATTYGEVGEAAFGKCMEYFISFILFVLLCFGLIGYMVLIKDIWTSIIQIVFNMEDGESPNGNHVLLAIVLLMSPFLVQRTLHALRYNCYIGFGSVSVLCLALCHHAITSPLPSPLLLWTTSWNDILFSFPLITLSFFSIFNVLPVQNALIEPSRDRVLSAIDGAMTISFLLNLIFGLAGYFYAGANTNGNILKNGVERTDFVFFFGQLGCGITIMLGMAMMMLPCRASLLEVVDVAINGPHVVPIDIMEGETIPLVVAAVASDNSKGTNSTVAIADKNGGKNQTKQRRRASVMDNDVVHYVSTFAIAGLCCFCAIRAPGVEVVWSLCGCFLAYLVAFILPAACYLEIQRKHPERSDPGWVAFSCISLFASTIAAVACTIQTASQFV